MPPSERSTCTWCTRRANRSGRGSRSRLMTSAPPATRRPSSSRPMTPEPPVTTILCGMGDLLSGALQHRRDDALAALAIDQPAGGRRERVATPGIRDQTIDRARQLFRRAIEKISDVDAAVLGGEPA